MRDRFSPSGFSLRQLQYLVAVAETGSFSRAAERCRVSQPSLSAQVAQLEETWGVQVFERGRRGVMPTRAGEILIGRARSVLRAAEDLEQAAEATRDPWSATWRFGIIPTLAAYLLPTLAPALSRAHPGLRVLWTETTTPNLVEALEAGRLEAAVLAVEADLKSLKTCPLGQDAFVLAVAAGHRLARERSPVSVDDLDDERLLLLEDGHCLRDQALEVCRRADPDDAGFAATSLTTLVEMVAVGEGVTLLPSVAVGSVARDPRLALRPFVAPMPHRTIGLAWRPESALGSQLTEVARLLREVLRASCGSAVAGLVASPTG